MSERVLNILITSFPRILGQGLLVTIPLTAISFALALVIAVICAMVQIADVKGLKQIVRFYIWIIRGTPLLVQLYLVYFGLPDLGIALPAFPCAVAVFALNEGPTAPRRSGPPSRRCPGARWRRATAWE